VFERFDHDARRAVAAASEAARGLGHDHIGTEHLLLGVLQTHDGAGERALRTMGISLERVRNHVVRIVGTGDASPAGAFAFTPPARRALELAGKAADARGSSEVGSGHLLLGLIGDSEGFGARILIDLDATDDAIRTAVDMLPPSSPHPDTDILPEPRLPDISRSAFEGPVDFGWRGRPIVLAALGAAALSRLAFHPSRTGGMSPLEMQILASMALETGGEGVYPPGISLERLDVTLASELAELDDPIQSLVEQGLLVYGLDDSEDTRAALTQHGVAAVQAWLARLAPLFGGWPTSHEGVDDAIG
jgi:ATP-dependent Clp protease ATP-binding subunit ClpC